MKKTNLCHKNAIYYILNYKNVYKENIFENAYINKVYNDLVSETRNSYSLIKKSKCINLINESLDKKRNLSKEFKKLTNITWML